MEAGDLLVPAVDGAVVFRRNWAEMPTDVVREIGGAIQGMEDYVRFASVCKSWYSPLLSSRWECPKLSKRLLGYPWLMLVEEQQGECVEKKRGFYSLCTGKQFNLDLPESYGRACFGTSCGWLLTMGLDLKMHLLNPITREQLPLPSQTTFTHQYPPEYSTPDYLRLVFIHKVLVIYDEHVDATEDHRRTPLVFVIYSQYHLLAMARPGDSSWTPIPHSSLDRGFLDVTSFRDQVIVYNTKRILICNFSASPPRLEDLCAPRLEGHNNYIVDLGGELYTLSSWQELSPPRSLCNATSPFNRCCVTMWFGAYKLDFVKKTWEQVGTLGGWAVFVGRNSSFALSTLDYPQCWPNCIYFTDDNCCNFEICGGCDWGIYHYETGSKDTGNDDNGEENYSDNEFFGEECRSDKITSNPFPISHDQFSTYSPLLWVAPNLW